VFANLAVAASYANQLDTTTDFVPGSDKINLAAFGALAFMHLDSTSTTVPPHTLAWIYDGASNETIVYVNPTDETLYVGDSAMLQIHLQGVTSVQASDFIYDPAATTVAAAIEAIDPALAAIAAGDVVVLTASATDVPPVRTVSEDTRWTLPADDESF